MSLDTAIRHFNDNVERIEAEHGGPPPGIRAPGHAGLESEPGAGISGGGAPRPLRSPQGEAVTTGFVEVSSPPGVSVRLLSLQEATAVLRETEPFVQPCIPNEIVVGGEKVVKGPEGRPS